MTAVVAAEGSTRGRAVAGHLGVFVLGAVLVTASLGAFVREPGRTLPLNTDPRLFTWVMVSVLGS